MFTHYVEDITEIQVHADSKLHILNVIQPL